MSFQVHHICENNIPNKCYLGSKKILIELKSVMVSIQEGNGDKFLYEMHQKNEREKRIDDEFKLIEFCLQQREWMKRNPRRLAINN